MKCCLNSSNLEYKIIQCIKLGILLLSSQQGVGQSSDINLLFMGNFSSNLNSHLIRPTPKKKKKKKKQDYFKYINEFLIIIYNIYYIIYYIF